MQIIRERLELKLHMYYDDCLLKCKKWCKKYNLKLFIRGFNLLIFHFSNCIVFITYPWQCASLAKLVKLKVCLNIDVFFVTKICNVHGNKCCWYLVCKRYVFLTKGIYLKKIELNNDAIVKQSNAISSLIRPVTRVSRVQNWVGYVFFLQKVCIDNKIGYVFCWKQHVSNTFHPEYLSKIWVLGQLLNTSITCKIKVKVDIKMIPRLCLENVLYIVKLIQDPISR